VGDQGGFDWVEEAGNDEVVFLDEDEDLNELPWLHEERVHGGRDPARLPPHAPRPRVLASLLALAIFLGTTGTTFRVAYHRHVTDRRIANLLDLAPAASAPQIRGLVELGFQQTWHAKLTEQVVMQVLNRSPEPVVLLGAVLEEPGMLKTATLKPVGATTLKPGQAGTVAGEVSVDCTQDPAAISPLVDDTASVTVAVPGTSALLVRARTASGQVAEAAVDPDANGPNVQERICLQQGNNVTGATALTLSGNPRTHIATVDFSVPSNADIALDYKATATYSADPAPGSDASELPYVSAPKPTLPTTGTLKPGATVKVAFAIQVSNCTSARSSTTDNFYLQFVLTAKGIPINSSEDGMQLNTVLTAACGSF